MGDIQKQCALMTADARSTASIMGDILLSKSMTFMEISRASFHLLPHSFPPKKESNDQPGEEAW